MTFLLQIAIGLIIVGAFVAILVALGNIIPTSFIVSAITSANGYFGLIHGFLPYTTNAIFVGAFAIFAVETSIGTYKIVMWVLRKFPGIT